MRLREISIFSRLYVRADVETDTIKGQMDFGPLKAGRGRRRLGFRPSRVPNVVFPAEEIALSGDKSDELNDRGRSGSAPKRQ